MTDEERAAASAREKTQRADHIAALEREKQGYEARGEADLVKGVDTEIKRVRKEGITPAGKTETAAVGAPEKTA
jgi:hypothetical protein